MAIPRSPLPRFPQHSSDWTAERIDKLERAEIEQLRSNAVNLGEEGVAAMCDAVLATKPKTRRGAAKITTLKGGAKVPAKVTALKGPAKVTALKSPAKGAR
jgi:hypothetical protein